MDFKYVKHHGYLIYGHVAEPEARATVEAPADSYVGYGWWGGEELGFVYEGHSTAQEVTIVHHMKPEDRPGGGET